MVGSGAIKWDRSAPSPWRDALEISVRLRVTRVSQLSNWHGFGWNQSCYGFKSRAACAMVIGMDLNDASKFILFNRIDSPICAKINAMHPCAIVFQSPLQRYRSKFAVAHATNWKIPRTRVFFCCLSTAAQAKTFRDPYSELNREVGTQHWFLLWRHTQNIR